MIYAKRAGNATLLVFLPALPLLVVSISLLQGRSSVSSLAYNPVRTGFYAVLSQKRYQNLGYKE